MKSKYCSVGLGCVPVEQDDQVCVTCVRDELVRDLGHVITGFLWDNRMKPTASRRNNLGGVPACWAWVPLKHRETVLMMHEVTVCIVEVAMPRWFGKPAYRNIGKIVSMGFWNGPTSTGLGTDGKVGSRKGGTSTPFLVCNGESGMWSHLGGIDMGL